MIKINKIQGFTLLELMITLAIAAIITTIGLPSFTGLMRDSRMTTNVNDFLTALSYARSEAATRNVDVIVQSKSGINLDWKQGWDIYIDVNSNNIVDAGELLKTHIALPTGYTLTANVTSLNTQIVYEPSGLRNTIVGGSIYLCLDNDVNTARAVVINPLGRARVDSSVGVCS